jgi:hypothetical protein
MTTFRISEHLQKPSCFINTLMNHQNLISLMVRLGGIILHLTRHFHHVHQPRTLDASKYKPYKTFSPFLQTKVRRPLLCRKAQGFNFNGEATFYHELPDPSTQHLYVPPLRYREERKRGERTECFRGERMECFLHR